MADSLSKKSAGKISGGLSMVLPAYNEGKNIQAVVDEAKPILDKIADRWEIIIVDDGSTDGTGAISQKLAQDNSRIKLVSHSNNQGYGSALASGFKAATMRWIFFTDADRQFRIAEIERLIPGLGSSKMVIGFREQRGDRLHRRVYGTAFTGVVNLLFGLSVKDVNCAFKIFDRSVIEGERMISRGALINAELLSIAKSKGIKPVQVPVSHFPRQAGAQTGGSLKVILRAAGELVRLFFHRLRKSG